MIHLYEPFKPIIVKEFFVKKIIKKKSFLGVDILKKITYNKNIET